MLTDRDNDILQWAPRSSLQVVPVTSAECDAENGSRVRTRDTMLEPRSTTQNNNFPECALQTSTEVFQVF
jgi:hypothetical protein